MVRKTKSAPHPSQRLNGRKLWLNRLLQCNDIEGARSYAAKHGIPFDQGRRGFAEGQAESVNSSTSADLKSKNVPLKNYGNEELEQEMSTRGYVFPRGPLDDNRRVPVRITDEGGAVTGTTIVEKQETALEASQRRELERVTIAPFTPAREPLPREARYALITRVATNPLMREVRFEDNGLVDRLWVTNRQNARGMAPVGRVVAVTWCEDPEGWKLWAK